MIISTIKVTLPTEKHNDALTIFRSNAVQTRYDPGCISHSIYRDIEDENVLMIQGVWKTEEDMAFHVRSDEYLNLLLVLEMSPKHPLIKFDTISGSTGIETIKKIRSTIHKG